MKVKILKLTHPSHPLYHVWGITKALVTTLLVIGLLKLLKVL
jgi:hypothetical protein